MHKYGPNAVGCESRRVSTLCEPAMNKSVEMDTSSKAVTVEKMCLIHIYKCIVIFSIGTFHYISMYCNYHDQLVYDFSQQLQEGF